MLCRQLVSTSKLAALQMPHWLEAFWTRRSFAACSQAWWREAAAGVSGAGRPAECIQRPLQASVQGWGARLLQHAGLRHMNIWRLASLPSHGKGLMHVSHSVV